ncbi:FRG domain-containing protein [Massilia sp. P8910]|uniref:FRG domain-containing protein n=1 Tax=Massilia antarctica TaxID=2765360 RepID=UPI001E41C3E4|nr:FRG domain-containing protein [Massilia antarctica]MCE3606443.1 FRG domain-containing protein [Massilia antarctica]
MILEQSVSNIGELISGLAELTAIIGDEVVWFRGHSSDQFQLLPSIARDAVALQRESLLSKRFKQNAHPFRQVPPQNEWEWLFLMQHFGVPTRVLDWTESPLVALYFAVSDDDQRYLADDAHIWVLLPAKFNFEIPRFRPAVQIDIPSFGVDPFLEDYKPDVMALELMSNRLPVAAIAHRQNERIMAQLGVFTIMHRDATPLDKIAGAAAFFARFTIPAAAKSGIKSELKSLRITRMTLFPELSSVAAITKEALL